MSRVQSTAKYSIYVDGDGDGDGDGDDDDATCPRLVYVVSIGHVTDSD